MESFALSFASMLLALALVIALAWGLLRLMRSRLQPRGTPGPGGDDSLRYVRALQLGAKERLVLVEHRGERWMLGVTAGGISTVAHWPRDAIAAASAAASAAAPRSGDAGRS